MRDASPKPEISRLIAVGRLLYGERFGSSLARGLSVDPSYVSLILADKRPVTQDLEHRLRLLITVELSRRESEAIALRMHLKHTWDAIEPDPAPIAANDDS